MARKPWLVLCALLMVGNFTGCVVTVSAYVQKDWNTNPDIYKNNDLTTRVQLSASKGIGVDAKEVKK